MRTENGVEYGDRPSPLPRRGPSEASEQLLVVRALRRAGLCYMHVPLGGARSRRAGAEARRLGASKGFPDLLIFDAPPKAIRRPDGGWPCGVALELKRPVAGSRPSAEQVAWLEQLAQRGWLATVQWGAEEALGYLRRRGYTV